MKSDDQNVMVGRHHDGKEWRDPVFLKDLAPWARAALQRYMDLSKRVCDRNRDRNGPGHIDGCPDGMEPFATEGGAP